MADRALFALMVGLMVWGMASAQVCGNNVT